MRGIKINHHRNKPCPCGSGFKYKKCCLQKGSGGDIKRFVEMDKVTNGTNLISGMIMYIPRGEKILEETVRDLEKIHRTDYSSLEQIMVHYNEDERLVDNLNGIKDSWFINVLQNQFVKDVKENKTSPIPTLGLMIVGQITIYRLPLFPNIESDGIGIG